MTRRIETVEWGVETDDLGSMDIFETETEARAALADGGTLVRITTTVEHDPSTPVDARKGTGGRMTRIETTEALDALAPWSVVLDATGLAWQMRDRGEWHSADAEEFWASSDELDAFPIRVLHDPSAPVDAPTSGGDVNEAARALYESEADPSFGDPTWDEIRDQPRGDEARSRAAVVISALAMDGSAARASAAADLAMTIALSDDMAGALALMLHDAHPCYESTATWHGGIGGMSITQGCSVIDPPPGAEWAQNDLLSQPLRRYIEARPGFDLTAAKKRVMAAALGVTVAEEEGR